MPTPRRPRSRGVTLIEVLVVAGVLLVALMVVAMLLTAGREGSRAVLCQRNLRDLGAALTLFDNAVGRLPTVPEPVAGGSSPQAEMLGQLGLTGFAGLADSSRPKLGAPAQPPKGTRLADLICPSDPFAADPQVPFPAPVSYRACAGGGADGRGGPFSPGEVVSLESVRQADGTAYTAAFAERLVGDGRPASTPIHYALVPGPIGDSGCGAVSPGAWRGDAGSDWSGASWISTLYNHALTPGASPSCVAEGGRSARMGASSGHPNRVHVLMLDGSLRPVTPAIAPEVWRVMGTVDDSRKEAAPAGADASDRPSPPPPTAAPDRSR